MLSIFVKLSSTDIVYTAIKTTKHCFRSKFLLLWYPLITTVNPGQFLLPPYLLLILDHYPHKPWLIPSTPNTHSNHMTSSKRVDTFICHTTMCRNSIKFIYNSGHVTPWCFEVVPVVYARVLPIPPFVCVCVFYFLFLSSHIHALTTLYTLTLPWCQMEWLFCDQVWYNCLCFTCFLPSL